MREIRMSGSMRGRRKRTALYRACVLLYGTPGYRSCRSYIHATNVSCPFAHRLTFRPRVIYPVWSNYQNGFRSKHLRMR